MLVYRLLWPDPQVQPQGHPVSAVDSGLFDTWAAGVTLFANCGNSSCERTVVARWLGNTSTRRGNHVYYIRHGTRDIGIFSEIFIAGEYEPPPTVQTRLDELGRPPRILDLGAYTGLFATYCTDRWPGASVTSVEPDVQSLEVLRCTAAQSKAISIVEGCAATHDGSALFLPGQFAESHVLSDETVPGALTVQSVDMFRLAGAADLIKMDIEGSEWPILADSRMRSVYATAWVMEWHSLNCPYPAPADAARELLEQAGFEVVLERTAIAGHNGVVWALRTP